MIDDADRDAIVAILARQNACWAAGDAEGFTADTAEGVVFTNITGMFSIGQPPFTAQHAHIFGSFYKGSTLEQELVALTPVRPDVAIVDTLARVSGGAGHPPGILPIDGAVCTRLEQVMVRDAGVWRVAAFHNVAILPGGPGGPR